MSRISIQIKKNLHDLEFQRWLNYFNIVLVITGTTLVALWLTTYIDFSTKTTITVALTIFAVPFIILVSGKLAGIKKAIEELA